MSPEPRQPEQTEGFDVRPIVWDDGVLLLLDQRALPSEERWVACRDVPSVVAAIRDMVVRGAPAIGVAAAYGVALAAYRPVGDDAAACLAGVEAAGALLRGARPTAVNLAWAVDLMLDVARRTGRQGGRSSSAGPPEDMRAALVRAAAGIEVGEREACRAIGRHGASLVPDVPGVSGVPGAVRGANILTHCNAGALATGGYGTALGVVRAAVEAGKAVHVWVDETRPVLQGARLTAWELARAGIPNTLVVDAASPSLIARGEVDLVVVGADRIAANGDVANKIGTYGLALAARAGGVPFVVAAPVSTVDLACPDGGEMRIEDRDPAEVVLQGCAVPGQRIRNPAFDVTPADLVSAIVTERGIVRPPYGESLRAVVAGAG